MKERDEEGEGRREGEGMRWYVPAGCAMEGMSELPPSLLPPSSPSLPIHVSSAWSCDSEGV